MGAIISTMTLPWQKLSFADQPPGIGAMHLAPDTWLLQDMGQRSARSGYP